MNNGIKEILDKLKEEIDLKPLWYNERIKLLDYITNLQEEYDNEVEENLKLSEWLVEKQLENERLKQPKIFIDTQDMEERYGEELYKDYLEKQVKDYKSRIEKAVEYIKEHVRIDDEYPFYMYMLIDDKHELLNILNG